MATKTNSVLFDRGNSNIVLDISFFFCFVFSFPIYSIIPISLHQNFTIFLFAFSLLIGFFNIKKIIFSLKSNYELNIFLIIFFVASIISKTFKNDLDYFILVSPIMTFIAYSIITTTRLNINLIFLGIVILYIYYYNIYFANLPSIFNRISFNFDEEANFSGASSNAIPIVLNNLVYITIVLNHYFKLNKLRIILIFCVVNIFLIFIQNSRAGIIVSIVLFLITLVEFSPTFYKRFKYLIYLITSLIIFYTLRFIINLFDSKNLSVENIMSEGRGLAQIDFFTKMDQSSFFFGYPEGTKFFIFDYTYNVFLDLWNETGFLFFLFFIFIFFKRFIESEKYLIPLIFFVPFLIYSTVETIYFPKYWDFFICIMLFVKKPNQS